MGRDNFDLSYLILSTTMTTTQPNDTYTAQTTSVDVRAALYIRTYSSNSTAVPMAVWDNWPRAHDSVIASRLTAQPKVPPLLKKLNG